MSKTVEIGNIEIPLLRAMDGVMWLHQELGKAQHNGETYRLIQPINVGIIVLQIKRKEQTTHENYIVQLEDVLNAIVNKVKTQVKQ